MAIDGAFLSALILLAPPSRELRVDEAGARLSIDGAETRISFPIHNDSHEEIPVLLEAELLDPKGVVVSRGESRFAFRFRPRFSMRAKSSMSRLYYYYNPEAEVVLAPPTFRVR